MQLAKTSKTMVRLMVTTVLDPCILTKTEITCTHFTKTVGPKIQKVIGYSINPITVNTIHETPNIDDTQTTPCAKCTNKDTNRAQNDSSSNRVSTDNMDSIY